MSATGHEADEELRERLRRRRQPLRKRTHEEEKERKRRRAERVETLAKQRTAQESVNAEWWTKEAERTKTNAGSGPVWGALGPEREKKTEDKPVVSQVETVDLSQVVMCPFCLEEGQLQKFLVSTKAGVSQSTGKCPFCHNGMRMHNLLKQWTPEEYADWVFGYRKAGFFQKIDFQAWREKLVKKNWAGVFWPRYNALKGAAEKTGENESYADRMNRLGEEAARKWTEEGQRPDDYESFPEY